MLAVAEAAVERRYEPGAVVIDAGERSTGFYILAEGDVDVETPDRAHRSLAAPNFFGELAMISGGERTATVTARTAITAFVVERSVVAGLLAEDPMARELIAGLGATRPRSPRSAAPRG